jgi:LPPG:FO 2-phospho-L-lactate transferase
VDLAGPTANQLVWLRLLRPHQHSQPTDMSINDLKIAALAGGIGGAKLLLGMASVVAAERLTVIANTGDDIKLHGLHISPDVDTITYTLAEVVSQERGWGIKDDTFHCLEWLSRYDQPQWFNLGDRDLATHLYRTQGLAAGLTLSEVTDRIRRSLAVKTRILPMTDDYTPTWVDTDEGEMHLQEYFVRRRCQPRVKAIQHKDVAASSPASGVVDSILNVDVVVICPSNPFISVAPILAVPGVRDALMNTTAFVVAVTPIVGGRALKGPAADMLRDLGHEVSALGVARLYHDFVDLFVLDQTDSSTMPDIARLGLKVTAANTIMNTLADKQLLAGEVLESAHRELQLGVQR